ncbi:hypothetical protein AALB_2085 [Agarivorans albus MKT 106]|uniref:Uncharacterized protein n=1 Tax=Agarivorans albus MKT 106 TaxID=1331007 RepID=R9PKZ0_AGAAL|nr:hypothetical protein AALB_2085 [Agarivorans albus MKT 106]
MFINNRFIFDLTGFEYDWLCTFMVQIKRAKLNAALKWHIAIALFRLSIPSYKK